MNVQVLADGQVGGGGAWHEGVYRRGLYGERAGARRRYGGSGAKWRESYGACLYSEL